MNKKPYKSIIIIGVVISFCVLLICLVSSFSLTLYGNVDESIVKGTDIYIPESVPKKYHTTIFSIDTFDYWIFKLDDGETTEIESELENGNWNKLETFHILKLSEVDYLSIIGKYSSLKNNCYLCIYDLSTGEIITNNNEYIIADSCNWVVFLYDADTNYYFCFHERY